MMPAVGWYLFPALLSSSSNISFSVFAAGKKLGKKLWCQIKLLASDD